MTAKVLVVGIILIAAAAVIIGCGDEAPTAAVSPAPLVRTQPADGATAVAVGMPIHMMFNDPVDTTGFDEWFYCVDGNRHDVWMDSLEHGMMGMGGMHFDSSMFRNRMREGRVRGQLHWNHDADSCIFMPDEDLMHGTEYVMHFGSRMRNHHGERMHHMGEMLTDDIMVRFQTMGP